MNAHVYCNGDTGWSRTSGPVRNRPAWQTAAVSRPRITVHCDCGESLLVPYPEAAVCACGRRWDTSQISAADYRGVLAVRRRYRRHEGAFVLTVVFLLSGLTILGRSAPLLITIPVFIVIWARFFRPWWRQRRHKAIQGLPTWKLKPVGGDVPPDPALP